jgi:L-fuculose-phosphate aldolase
MTTEHHKLTHLRQQVVDTQTALVEKGLTSGASGNVSARYADGMLITPTGVAPGELSADKIVQADLAGQPVANQLLPSSEWQMHADIYRHKPEVNAVVHCHSTYATILACARKTIPAMHYMVAAAGSDHIPLADYATFGTQALSNNNLKALTQSRACLLASHGQLATGDNLDSALALAELVEEQAHWYWGALAIGGATILDNEQMGEVLAAFESYGQQR